MKNTVDKIPFLRLTAALSAGIVLGAFLPADAFLIYILLVFTTALLIWLNAHYGYKRAAFFGMGVHLFFIATGSLLYSQYSKKPEFFNNVKFIAVVKEIAQEKTNSYQSILKVHSVIRNDSIISAGENVLVYFEKDNKSKTLLPGQVILFTASPRDLENTGNPFEFNYKGYMERRKIYRQLYLTSDKWVLTDKTAPFDISLFAEQVRMKLLNIYKQQEWNNRQLNVLSALTLGYKRGLSPETKNTFASAGAMHILAVSGLHTGIVFLIVNFLFGFLKKIRFGRVLFILLVILSLWCFAFLTGLSPSVMRAATMFSFVVIGQNLRRPANVYNTLATSAFFLLLLNPNNLFEAGFQLSYSAVFGIVFLQPKFEKLICFRLKVIKYFWSLFTVSAAAQIATFPVALFYFNQFPVYFWLSNLFIIPAVTLLIPLGIILLVFSPIAFVQTLLADVTGLLLNMLIEFLEWIKQLPVSVVNFHLTEVELLFLLSALLSFFFFIGLKKTVYFKTALVLILVLMSTSLIRNTIGLFRNEIIQYNLSDQNVIHLVSGKRNYIISEEILKENDRVHDLIKNTVLGLQLHPPVYLTCSRLFIDPVVYVKDGLILFNGQVVHFYTGNRSEISPFTPDIIIGKATIEKNQ